MIFSGSPSLDFCRLRLSQVVKGIGLMSSFSFRSPFHGFLCILVFAAWSRSPPTMKRLAGTALASGPGAAWMVPNLGMDCASELEQQAES